MFLLRMLSFFAGGFVLFGAPLLLAGGVTAGSPFMVVLAVLTVLLFAGAYFFFALLGHRTGRSPRLRYIGGGLAVFQLLAGAWLLAASQDTRALVAAAPLLCFTVFLFMAFVWPAESFRTHRPMRRRDRFDELHYH
jgi:hypothetical protein